MNDGHGIGQIFQVGIPQGLVFPVALLQPLEELVQADVQIVGEARRGAVGFQAALAPALSQQAVGVQADMAEFRRPVVHTVVQFAVYQHGAAHAPA